MKGYRQNGIGAEEDCAFATRQQSPRSCMYLICQKINYFNYTKNPAPSPMTPDLTPLIAQGPPDNQIVEFEVYH